MGLPIFILAIPLISSLIVNYGYFNEFQIFSIFTVPKLYIFRSTEISIYNIFDNINIFGILLINDGLSYNSIEQYGTLFIFSIPLIFYGIVISSIKFFKCRAYDGINLVFILFLCNFLTIMIIENPGISKANAIYFTLVYMIIMAIKDIININSKIIYIFVIFYIVGFLSFSNFYFNEYQKVDDLPLFDDDLTLVVQYLEENYNGKIVHLHPKTENEAYIYIMYELHENPYDYKDLYNDKNINISNYYFDGWDVEINQEDIYVMSRWMLDKEFIKILDKNGFKCIEYYEYLIYSR